MTPAAQAFLVRMQRAGGTWPDRPIINRDFGRELMQLGLIELVKPAAPQLPYAKLTRAGAAKAARLISGGTDDNQEEDESQSTP